MLSSIPSSQALRSKYFQVGQNLNLVGVGSENGSTTDHVPQPVAQPPPPTFNKLRSTQNFSDVHWDRKMSEISSSTKFVPKSERKVPKESPSVSGKSYKSHHSGVGVWSLSDFPDIRSGGGGDSKPHKNKETIHSGKDTGMYSGFRSLAKHTNTDKIFSRLQYSTKDKKRFV